MVRNVDSDAPIVAKTGFMLGRLFMTAHCADGASYNNEQLGETKMSHYIIAQVKVNDDSWIPEYAANVHDIVHRHNGKYLARSGNITTLEGEESSANLIALIEFPTEEALQAFVSDPDYAPYAKARQAGTDSHFVAVDATDAAGSIPYLAAGG